MKLNINVEVEQLTINVADRKQCLKFTNIGPFVEQFIERITEVMNITMTDTQKVTLGPVTGTDARGNPAPLDSTPVWDVGDSAMLTVTPSADGLSADVATVGALGTGQVTVIVTENNGNMLTGIVDFTVVAGEATSMNIPAGTPIEQ